MICKEGGKESLEVTNASEVSNENKKSKKCSQKGIVKVSQYTFVCEKEKNKNAKGDENRRGWFEKSLKDIGRSRRRNIESTLGPVALLGRKTSERRWTFGKG